MMQFKRKYITNFLLITPAEKVDLTLLLKTLIEFRTEYGISVDTILYCLDSNQSVIIKFTYDDAIALINGNISEDEYVERHQSD